MSIGDRFNACSHVLGKLFEKPLKINTILQIALAGLAGLSGKRYQARSRWR